MPGPQREDLTGRQFGRLTVMELDSYGDAPDRHGYWTCQCECGNTIVSRDTRLKSGRTVSCGCWRAELAASALSKISAERRHQIAQIGIKAAKKARLKRAAEASRKTG